MKGKKLLTWGGSVLLVAVLASLSLMTACVAPPPTTTPAPEVEKEPWELMKPTVWRYQSCNVLGSNDTCAVEVFKEEIEAKTHGRLKVEIYPSGGLGYPLDKMVSATRDGLIEISECIGFLCHGEYYLSDIGEFWCHIPYDMDCQIMVADALKPYFNKTMPSQYNQYFLDLWFGDPMGFFAKKPITSLDDIVGLKLRAKGVYQNKLLTALGATPVSMPPTEMYDAISRGIVDGCVTSPCYIYDNKMWEVVKYSYHLETGSTQIYYTFNKDAFDALPEGVQDWALEAWSKGMVKTRKQELEAVNMRIKGLVDNGMGENWIIPGDVEKIWEITKPCIDEYVAEGGLLAKEAMAAINATIAKCK